MHAAASGQAGEAAAGRPEAADDHDQDLAVAMLTLRAAAQVVAGIQHGMAARFPGLRPAHGFAFVRISAGGATVTDVAEHLGVTKQAASQLVAQLVEGGYVTRRADPRDRRTALLVLTDRGRACTRAAEEAAAAAAGQWREQLGDEAMSALAAALRQVARPGPLRPSW